jgi:hypothetical protein
LEGVNCHLTTQFGAIFPLDGNYLSLIYGYSEPYLSRSSLAHLIRLIYRRDMEVIITDIVKNKFGYEIPAFAGMTRFSWE